MKPISTITVSSDLPAALSPLRELALNLRWTWRRQTADLFRTLDPAAFAASDGNPIAMLPTVPASRLAEAARDESFLARMRGEIGDLRTYLDSGRWEGKSLVIDTAGFNGYAELDARGQPTSAKLHTVERLTLSADGSSIDIEVTITDPEYYDAPFTIKRSWKKSAARHPFEYDCMENPRQEDFENAYYVHERYRPTCMRVEGEGMALSKVVCRRPEE